MSVVSVTAANVTLAGTSPNGMRSGKLGETVTGGQVVIQKSADSLWYKADANGGTAEYAGSVAIGVAMGGGTSGVWITILSSGIYTVGGTLVAGTTYYLSETAGGIDTAAPATTGSYATVLGLATSTALLNLSPNVTGTTVA